MNTKMKMIYTIVILLIIVIGVLFTIMKGSVNTILPKIDVQDVQLTGFFPGEEKNIILPIKNRGLFPLTISEITACCGCKLPNGFPDKIAPMSEGYVLINCKMPLSNDSFDRSINILSNDRNKEKVTVNITGKPNNLLKLSPRVVQLGHVNTAKKVESTILIIVEDVKYLPQSVATSAPFIKANIKNDSENAYINIELLETSPRGELLEYLYIKTNIPDKPTDIIPIHGFIEKGLVIHPKIIYLRKNGDDLIRYTADIKILDEDWLNFKVTPKSELITTAIRQADQDKFLLTISVNPIKITESLKTELVLVSSKGDSVVLPIWIMNEKNPEPIL